MDARGEDRWVKYYADLSVMVGTDAEIAAKTASWRNTQLTDMVGAAIYKDSYKCEIRGAGEYWQSDQMESVFPVSGASVVKRRIMRLITSDDTHFRVAVGIDTARVEFNSGMFEGGIFFPVNKNLHDRWLVLEYDVRSKTARYYFKDHRV